MGQLATRGKRLHVLPVGAIQAHQQETLMGWSGCLELRRRRRLG